MCFFFPSKHFRFSKIAPSSVCFFSTALLKPFGTFNNSKFYFFSASKACLSASNQYYLIAIQLTSSSSVELFLHQYLLTFDLFLFSLQILFLFQGFFVSSIRAFSALMLSITNFLFRLSPRSTSACP